MTGKEELNKIRQEFPSKGDIVFRTAISMVVENGQNSFQDDLWFDDQMDMIDHRHDIAEAQGKHPFMTRDFEKALMRCAWEISWVDTIDLLQYVQTEMYFGGDGIDYKRAIRLLKDCINWIAEGVETADAYNDLMAVGFDGTELEELGYEYILDVYEEEEW